MSDAELSALRRIATLAVEGVAPSGLFAVVAEDGALRRSIPEPGQLGHPLVLLPPNAGSTRDRSAATIARAGE